MKLIRYVKGIFFTVIMMTTLSCTVTTDIVSKSIIGTWSWISTDGGIANHIHETPLNTGKTIDLKFTNDNTYSYYTNGVLSNQGTYSIENRKTIFDDINKKVIILFPQEVVMVIMKIDAISFLLSLTDVFCLLLIEFLYEKANDFVLAQLLVC